MMIAETFSHGRFLCSSNSQVSQIILLEMAGDKGPLDESQLKGLSKYFNSVTDRGRANVAKATYAGVALIALYFWLKPKKKQQ
ncbi:up-regulated during skeletal muscle growth protein 5 isoform X1 [Cimex lectularius]|uniref:Up-regulated during skeletal muscle growth protein 5 n=1 Tax=Cimex lectularius TaxID=79782 RepID=A0A8I6RSB2_CIMLE|nr:up-regulated during skeletal muscle growth protein 5 isoform X1 [Cimex lectularius]XP_024083599.1 up-regulated during skeletal muscle growth protein 5 isoform X1 [Cimex lectularius]